MRPAPQFTARLARDARGNVLPIAAIGMLVAITVVGAAVDLSRNYLARQQLQAACDAGVLAGRRSVTTNGFDATAQTAATNYFNTNFNDNAQTTRSTVFTPTSDDNGITVTATATTILDTLLMRVFGKDSFSISVNCASSMGVGNSDIMMVLDTTGSMDTKLGTQTRIQALRAAMKNFYSTIAAGTVNSNARVRYGFVPYSSTVNVGRLLYALNPNYLVDTRNYQSRQPFFLDYTQQTKTNSSSSYSNEKSDGGTTITTGYSTRSACESTLQSDTSYADTGSPTSTTSTPATGGVGSTSGTSTTTTKTSQTKTVYQCDAYSYLFIFTRYKSMKYVYTRDRTTTDTYNVPYSNVPTSSSSFDHWEYKSVPYDTSKFKTFAATTTYTGDSGAAQSTIWNGCIEERSTVNQATFSYNSITKYSPSAALDINIDSTPGTSDTSKWAPMWSQIAYTRAGSSESTFTTATTTTGAANAEYCPKAAQGLQTMTSSAFNTYADSLSAVGGTYLDIGLIWGGRMISPDGIFKDTVNDDPDNGGEVSRHLIFMTDGEMETYSFVYSAWGTEFFDRRVTAAGSANSNNTARHNQRFQAVCSAIKDKGIRLWVIAFTASLSDDLKTCASDDSSFVASSSAELNSAFQEIAKQVGELRVVK